MNKPLVRLNEGRQARMKSTTDSGKVWYIVKHRGDTAYYLLNDGQWSTMCWHDDKLHGYYTKTKAEDILDQLEQAAH